MSCESGGVWGTVIHPQQWGTFNGTAQIPPEGFLRLFLKPSSSVSRVQHTALTHYTHHHHQQFLHASRFICTLLSHIFICDLWQILPFSHVVHFCIARLLSTRFWGWLIWKVAAFRLQIQCRRAEAITRQAALLLNWSWAHDPYFFLSYQIHLWPLPFLFFPLSCYIFILLHFLAFGDRSQEISVGGTGVNQRK